MYIRVSAVMLLTLLGQIKCYCPSESTPTGEELKIVHESAFEFTQKAFETLYHENSPSKTNLIVSPYSMWQAMSVLFYGARGDTRRQLKKVLRLKGTNRKELCVNIGKMNDFWRKRALKDKDKYTFTVLNKLFFAKTEKLLPRVKKTFLSHEYKLLDFAGDVEGSQNAINKWVEDNTNGKIQKLISRLSPDSRVAVVNAVYFRAEWQNVFKEPHTTDEPFHLYDGTIVDVPTMKQTASFSLAASDPLQCQVIELPYEGDVISMFVFLPNEPTVEAMENIITKFTPGRVKKVVKSVKDKRINLHLPKFKVEMKTDITKMMQEMGLTDVFDKKKSDLTGFSKDAGLFVDTAVHKAFIEVDESGTEAAAASAFFMSRMMIFPADDTVQVNRPFVYMIYDKTTEVPVFIGTVVNPSV